MGLGCWQILVVLVIILLLFGAGKLPRVMGDLGKGLRSFKDGLKGVLPDDDKSDDKGSDQPKLPPSDKKGE